MKKIIRLFVVLFMLMFSVAPVYASESEVTNMNIDVSLDKSGTATITQTIHLSAYEGSEYYQIMSNMYDKDLKMVSVTEDGKKFTKRMWNSDLEASEKKNKFGQFIDVDDATELCFGVTHGKHTYVMTYTCTNFVNKYSDATGINYTFFELELPVRKATVSIKSYEDFTKENSRVYAFGYEGSVDFKDGKIVMSTSGDINKMQLFNRTDLKFDSYDTSLDDETYEYYRQDAEEGSDYDEYEDEDYDDEDDSRGIFGWGGSFVGLMVFASLIGRLFGSGEKKIRRHYKYSKKDKENTPMFHDLPTKDIVYGDFLTNEAGLNKKYYNERLVSAYMLRMVRDDNIRFVNTGKKDYVLEFISEPADDRARALYRLMIRNAVDHKITKKALANDMRTRYDAFRGWFNDFHNYQINTLKEKGHIINRSVDSRTVEDIHHTYGLYKFLKDADNMDEKRVIDVKLWDEYLIYAVLFDIADLVRKQIGNVCPQYFDESAYGSDLDSMTYAMLWAHDLTRASQAGYSAAQQATRSSGGGGFSSFGGGGGFSSGGGGGGLR